MAVGRLKSTEYHSSRLFGALPVWFEDGVSNAMLGFCAGVVIVVRSFGAGVANDALLSLWEGVATLPPKSFWAGVDGARVVCCVPLTVFC